jgi:signal transduction histidine kinase
MASYIPIVVIIFGNNQMQIQQAQQDAQEDALQQAHEIALFYRQEIQQLEDVLLLLTQTHFIKEWDMNLCMEVVPDMLSQFPNWSNIAVLDAEGTAHCSSVPETVGLSYTDRPFIQAALQTGKITYSGFNLGRVTGQPTLAIAMPILDADGTVSSIIGIAVLLDVQSEFIAHEVLQPNYRMIIIDNNNTVLIAYPEPERWLGRTYGDNVVQNLEQETEGTFEAIGLDDQARLFGFAKIEPAASTVFVSIDESIAFAEVNRIPQRNLMMLAVTFVIATLLIMLAARLIAQPLRQFSLATEQFANGDLSKRMSMNNGILEIAQIQRTFNKMAHSIEARITERTAALQEANLQLIERTAALQEANMQLAEEIKARKETEEKLEHFNVRLQQSNQDLEQFALIASHDLREPLRKVSAFNDRLQRDNLSGEQRQDYLKRVQDAVKRMTLMIDNLLMYSRIEQQHNTQTSVNLTTVAQQAVSDLNELIHETQGNIHIEALPTIRADAMMMHRLFQNLIANALKYHREGVSPVVKLTTQENDQYVHIRVQDNGVGIPETDSERIFRIFERLHGRHEGGGSGLGLAICRKIVLYHGGTVTVESIVGEGSTFIVSFPSVLKVISKSTDETQDRMEV